MTTQERQEYAAQLKREMNCCQAVVRAFADAIKEKRPDAEIVFQDERLSTVAATKSLIAADVSRKKRKKVIDKMAAVFILQGYLDSLAK